MDRSLFDHLAKSLWQIPRNEFMNIELQNWIVQVVTITHVVI